MLLDSPLPVSALLGYRETWDRRRWESRGGGCGMGVIQFFTRQTGSFNLRVDELSIGGVPDSSGNGDSQPSFL